MSKLKEKALPDFYANTAETTNIRWDFTEEEKARLGSSRVKKALCQLFDEFVGEGTHHCALASN